MLLEADCVKNLASKQDQTRLEQARNKSLPGWLPKLLLEIKSATSAASSAHMISKQKFYTFAGRFPAVDTIQPASKMRVQRFAIREEGYFSILQGPEMG